MNIKKGSVLPAITTPFKKDNLEIDIDAYSKHINWLLNNGVDGLVISGSTGEAPHLNREDRLKLLQSALDLIGDNKIIIAGTGAESLNRTLEYSIDASKHGAKALLIITPYYYRHNSENIIKYYREISDKLNKPILLYNFPQITGINIDVETASELIDGRKIIGIKDSSGNMINIIKLIKKLGGRGKILPGNPYISLPSIMMGADGVILAAANIIPAPLKEMINRVVDNDINDAMKIYWELIDVFNFISETGIPGIKRVLNHIMGYPIFTRPPLYPYPDDTLSRKISDICIRLNEEYK